MARYFKTTLGDTNLLRNHFANCILLVLGLSITTGCGVASSSLNANGTRYYQQGNHTAAIKRFEDALAMNPRDADSFYNLAATYHQLAKTGNDQSYAGQAENYYHQCLDVDPDHTDCYRGLAVLLTEQGRQDQAFRLLEGWKSRSPQLADPMIELARLHQEAGNTKAQEEHLLEAIAKDTTNPRARAALGRLREESGDYQQALADYNVSLSRNRTQPMLQARIAALNGSLSPNPIVAPNSMTTTAANPISNVRY